MGDVLITAPAIEPVTAAELRTYLRDAPDADGVLNGFIASAREHFEEATGLALINQTREMTLDAWPNAAGDLGWWDGVQEGSILGDAPRYVELRRAPLSSITSVKTFNDASVESTFDAANYFADTGKRPGRLVLNNGAVWPLPLRTAAGIKIRYVAGYGDAADAVPHQARQAILQIAAHWYENREAANEEAITRTPMQAGRIIRQMRIAKI